MKTYYIVSYGRTYVAQGMEQARWIQNTVGGHIMGRRPV